MTKTNQQQYRPHRVWSRVVVLSNRHAAPKAFAQEDRLPLLADVHLVVDALCDLGKLLMQQQERGLS